MSMEELILPKDSELYIFRYENNEESIKTLNRIFGKYASDNELSFTWYDSAILSQKVKKQKLESEMKNANNRL